MNLISTSFFFFLSPNISAKLYPCFYFVSQISVLFDRFFASVVNAVERELSWPLIRPFGTWSASGSLNSSSGCHCSISDSFRWLSKSSWSSRWSSCCCCDCCSCSSPVAVYRLVVAVCLRLKWWCLWYSGTLPCTQSAELRWKTDLLQCFFDIHYLNLNWLENGWMVQCFEMNGLKMLMDGSVVHIQSVTICFFDQIHAVHKTAKFDQIFYLSIGNERPSPDLYAVLMTYATRCWWFPIKLQTAMTISTCWRHYIPFRIELNGLIDLTFAWCLHSRALIVSHIENLSHFDLFRIWNGWLQWYYICSCLPNWSHTLLFSSI